MPEPGGVPSPLIQKGFLFLMGKSPRFVLLSLCMVTCGIFVALVLTGPYVAGARTNGMSAAPHWGGDVRVNPVVTGTRELIKNYSIVVNPTNPNTLLAGYDYA